VITAVRVAEVCSALRAAGAGWPDVARHLPEFVKLHHGKPGPSKGHVRPWVLLDGPHEKHDAPVRLIRHENGTWFDKGTYLHEIEGAHHGEA